MKYLFIVVMIIQLALIMAQFFIFGYDQALVNASKSYFFKMYTHRCILSKLIVTETVLVAALAVIVRLTQTFQPILLFSPLLAIMSDILYCIYMRRIKKNEDRQKEESTEAPQQN